MGITITWFETSNDTAKVVDGSSPHTFQAAVPPTPISWRGQREREREDTTDPFLHEMLHIIHQLFSVRFRMCMGMLFDGGERRGRDTETHVTDPFLHGMMHIIVNYSVPRSFALSHVHGSDIFPLVAS